MDKDQVADILEQIGLLLELKGENPFKTRAYENGARILRMLDEDLETIVDEKRLGSIQGIGQALEAKIEELILTGSLPYYETLLSEFPPTIFDLLKVPGLGAKKVRTLYIDLNIATLSELEKACQEGRLKDLKGFGEKTQQNILKGIEHIQAYTGRYLISQAGEMAVRLLTRLKGIPEILEVGIAGSLRRRKEIIKDIDMLVSSKEPAKVMGHIVSMPNIQEITGSGETKTSLRLQGGIGVDIRVVSPEQYPYALHHFTGSKEHNTKMRQIAKSMGLKMNEYGLFRGDEAENIPCQDETELFRALGMDFIPPELREDRGEIEAALSGQLPKLVTLEDILGIFHIHTKYSDGHSSIRELAEEVRRMGHQYLGIADHSRSAFYAGGLSIEAVKAQHQEIDGLNGEWEDFHIFKGIESDILADGALDYPAEILKTFDFIVASVHSGFKMDKKAMTNRILKAMDNPYTTILGHPTGRRILSREGYEVDVEEILKKAVETRVVIEINANPQRLDLDWRWCIRAKEMGVRFVISPDAHGLEELYYLGFGVSIARKGWLEKNNILNCLGTDAVKSLFN